MKLIQNAKNKIENSALCLFYLSLRDIPVNCADETVVGEIIEQKSMFKQVLPKYRYLAHKVELHRKVANGFIDHIMNYSSIPEEIPKNDEDFLELYPYFIARKLKNVKTFGPEDDLSQLAISGFSGHYIEHTHSNRFKIDFQYLDKYKMQDGIMNKGAIAEFEHAEGKLTIKNIVYRGHHYQPDCPEWNDIENVFRCSIYAASLIVKHLCVNHISVDATFGLAVLKGLSNNHPLKGFLLPHLNHAAYFSESKVPALITSIFPKLIGFTPCANLEIAQDVVTHFEFKKISPYEISDRGFIVKGHEVFYDKEGTLEKFDYPLMENLLPIFDAIHAHSQRIINEIYPDEKAVAEDNDIIKFLQIIQENVPKGLWFSPEKVNKKELSYLVTLLIYNSTAYHTSTLSIGYFDLIRQNRYPGALFEGYKLPSISDAHKSMGLLTSACKSRSQKIMSLESFAKNELHKKYFSMLVNELRELSKQLRTRDDFFIFPEDIGISCDK